MAEILGCGVPVVANEGVGDVADIIRKFRVGVLVRSVAYQDMESAFFDLQDLLNDPDLSARCRRAAEEVFSLEAGTTAYMALYSEVLSKYSRVSGESF
jgi:glycosyltransferase involved in cell wall biosynthesis